MESQKVILLVEDNPDDEMLAMRAYMYFDLVRMFNEPYAVNAESNNVPWKTSWDATIGERHTSERLLARVALRPGDLQPLLEDRDRLLRAAGESQRVAEVEQGIGVVDVRRPVGERVDRLLQDALHDNLTGLPNRRMYEFQLEKSLATARRQRTQLGLVYLDLDDFKKINDAHGHTVGDLVLIKICKSVQDIVRATDIFARYGAKLENVSVGCCGMAGTYGHETKNLQNSLGLYELSWHTSLQRLPRQRCLATGYSCRSQVKRIEGSGVRHPLQALLEIIG